MLDEEHLRYPCRREGMDHDLYAASRLHERAPVSWPGGAKVALWVTLECPRYPLAPNAEGPRAPGHMVTPYPDLRTYTTRDYGLRVGAYRVMRTLSALGVRATAFCSGSLAAYAPVLLEDLALGGHEIAGHGQDMNHVHHEGLSEDEEAAMIDRCLASFRGVGHEVRGWLSPGRFGTERTPRLLASAGLRWLADWGNDDMPYVMADGITAMPYTDELCDAKCMVTLGQREAVWADQVRGAHGHLAREAEGQGGRVLHVALTAHVIGQPFRIAALREALAAVLEAGAWVATGSEIEAAWRAAS